jgi:hypothetical protein
VVISERACSPENVFFSSRARTQFVNEEKRDPSNTQKDPDDWVTKDEPMTGAQRSYLKTLAAEAREEVDENMTKAEASKKIEELKSKSQRLQEGGAN